MCFVFIAHTGIHHFKIADFEAESQFLSNSCELVGALLKSAMEVTQETTSSTILNRDTLASAKYFCTEVVNKFLEPALAFLSQPHQTFLRHLAISTLLPRILRTITKLGVTSVTSVNLISSEMPEISRLVHEQLYSVSKILLVISTCDNLGNIQQLSLPQGNNLCWIFCAPSLN